MASAPFPLKPKARWHDVRMAHERPDRRSSDPRSGEKTRAKTRVDHRTRKRRLLVRRVQATRRDGVPRDRGTLSDQGFSIIYGILRNHNDAEDIAQQVFAKIYFSIGNFDFRSSLLTWIYKITVNECYDYLRKKRVRKLVYESDFSEEDSRRWRTRKRLWTTGPAMDETLAQRDLAVKLLRRSPKKIGA